jgi:hypothetical protein
MNRIVIAGIAAATVIGVAAAVTLNDGSGLPASSRETIAQPELGEMRKLPLAPDASRVDLALPSFSSSTKITNPLFPISDIHSSLLLGKVDGKPLRIEITLLPRTRVVAWDVRDVETLESQFVAYLDGRIHEVATDLYAQADDGAVWYFGEDVFNYEDGAVSDTEGTWRAGRGSPAAMIMPGEPRVGDVYRAENMPGVVFEQVTVKDLGRTVDGPTGPVEGAMVAEELHMEGDREDKTFAPGYGEFFSGYQTKENYEANALTIPADALDEPVPQELADLSSGADAVFAAARGRRWGEARKATADLERAYETLGARDIPRLLRGQLQDALSALDDAVRGRGGLRAAERALAVALATLDIELQYRPPVEVDLRRFDLAARRLGLDARAGDKQSVAGDLAALRWIGERFVLDDSQSRELHAQLRYLEATAEAGELDGVQTFAERLRTTIAGLEPTT